MSRFCDQCEAVSINGVPCHETGCINAWKCKTKCKECGRFFMPEERGQVCCDHSCSVEYSGLSCGCEECCPPEHWTVIVGNIGTVYDGSDEAEARLVYNDYINDSKTGIGRAGNEPVTLCGEGEPIEEYLPPEAAQEPVYTLSSPEEGARAREAGRRLYQNDDCEIYDDSRFSDARPDDDGVWVAAWVWVPSYEFDGSIDDPDACGDCCESPCVCTDPPPCKADCACQK